MRKFVTGRVIMLLLALVFVVSVAADVTYTWFASEREVGAEDPNMQIDADSLSAMPMTTYWSALVDETVHFYSSTGERVTLPTYDSVFTELNDRCRVFVRATVFGKTVNAGDPFTITLNIKDMFGEYEGSDENLNHYEYDEENGAFSTSTVALYLSNVATVKFTTLPALNDTSDENEAGIKTIYNTAKTAFDGETPRAFLNNKTKAKIGELVFTVSDYAADRKQISEEDGTYLLYIYFEIAYDPELIVNLMENHELELGAQSFDIESDFDKFVLDVASGD